MSTGFSWFPYFWMFWCGLIPIFAALQIRRSLRDGVVPWMLGLEFYRDEEPMTFWGFILLYAVVAVGASAMVIFAGPELIRMFA